VDLAIYGYAATAVLYTALSLVLWHDKAFQQGIGARVFFCASVSSGAWGWCAIAASRPEWAAAASIGASAFDFIRYALWLVCLLQLLRFATSGRRFLSVGVLTSVAALLLCATLVLTVLRLAQVPGGDELARPAYASALSLPVMGLVLIEQLYRNVTDDARWSVKPLCLGLGAVFVFDVYFFSQVALFSRFDADAISVRGAIHGLSAPLLLVAVRRQSNRSGNLRISRSAAFQTATLVLVGCYLLFVSAIGYYVRAFGGDWGSALQLALLFAAGVGLIIMLLSGTLRARLRVFLEKNFLTYRYDYRAEWLRLTSMLAANRTPEEVSVSVIRGLADVVESPAGALWFRTEGDVELIQTARWNMPRSPHRELLDSPLCRFLQDKGWVLDVDECRSSPGLYDGLGIPDGLLAMPACWLIVPLHVADDLVGLVVLAHARSPTNVNWEVRDLLKTASRQAAGFLAQIHAAEALLEAKKFVAFNRMSAFVVHDLKNIVTQLSLMLKNAQRLHANPEFQKDMLATIENSLDKMRQLMLQLRQGEAPGGTTSGVDLVSIGRRICAMASQRGRNVELQLAPGSVTRGDEARIERVLGHFVQNALDATSTSDRVWLAVERAVGQVEVVVGDTGRGMTEEFVRTRLFKPFTSTKESGMGIGAYESFQYVKELGGSIAVDSAVDRGTIITILLPLLETQSRSEPIMSSAK
jgi:putative PEP-CTERM system histidine kinase